MNAPSPDLFTFPRQAELLGDLSGTVAGRVAGLPAFERERAAEFLMAAHDLAVEMWFQKGDPGAPVWTSWERPWRKYGGDNPGTTYLSSPVSPRHQYRITGILAGAHYLGVQLYGFVRGFNAPTGSTNSRTLTQAHGGAFELVLGGEQPDGVDWLPLQTDDYLVMIRLYSYEPQHGATVSIERVDATPSAAPGVEARLDKVASYFKAEVMSTIQLTELMRAGGTNRFAPAGASVRQPEFGDSLFPTLDNRYEGFFVDLRPDEALVLHGSLPPTHYASFVFYDRWWASLDYPAVPCYLTDRDLVLNGDGSYDLVISPRDPGVPNWISMGGLTQGLYASRYLLADATPVPTVTRILCDEVAALIAGSRPSR